MSLEQIQLALEAPCVGSEKAVLLVLAWYAAPDGTRCWPAVGTVARQSGVCDREVRKVLKRFRERGWLVVEKASHGSLPTSYRLCLPLATDHPCTQTTPGVAPPVLDAPLAKTTQTPGVGSATPGVAPPNPSGIRHEPSEERAREAPLARDQGSRALRNGSQNGSGAKPDPDAAAWSALRERAAAIGFRAPWSVESLAVYDTQVRLAERDRKFTRS